MFILWIKNYKQTIKIVYLYIFLINTQLNMLQEILTPQMKSKTLFPKAQYAFKISMILGY